MQSVGPNIFLNYHIYDFLQFDFWWRHVTIDLYQKYVFI